MPNQVRGESHAAAAIPASHWTVMRMANSRLVGVTSLAIGESTCGVCTPTRPSRPRPKTRRVCRSERPSSSSDRTASRPSAWPRAAVIPYARNVRSVAPQLGCTGAWTLGVREHNQGGPPRFRPNARAARPIRRRGCRLSRRVRITQQYLNPEADCGNPHHHGRHYDRVRLPSGAAGRRRDCRWNRPVHIPLIVGNSVSA